MTSAGSPRRALRVTVVAQQPLSLGTEAEVAFYTPSHQHVPGSVLRGALAAAWISEHGTPTGDNPHAGRFRALFDGDIRFGPLLVEGSTRTPMSVHKCKYPVSEQCKQTIVDAAFEHVPRCPGCGRRLEAAKGELVMPTGFVMHRSTRTAINPKTGRTEDGMLYSQGALPTGTTLVGHIHGHDEWLERDRPLWLGGRRSVGGHAEYAVEQVDLPPPPMPADGEPLVLRLVTPAIFVDSVGRPRLDPDPVLDLAGTSVSRRGPWNRPATWSGWHAASGLPKPTELCAAAGSTYRITGSSDALARLARRAATEGVGLRRAEGFGVVEVATAPWRAGPTSTDAATVHTTAPDPAVVAFTTVRALNLDAEQHRWLLGVLRRLQVAHLSYKDSQVDEIVTDVFEQPTARGLSGNQRDGLQRLLTSVSSDVMRDLTTLVDVRLVGPDEAGQR